MHRVPTVLLVLSLSGPVSAGEVDLTPYLLPNRDDEWLKRSKVSPEPANLLKFLRSCQGPETPPHEIAALVGKLVSGDGDAAKGLVAIGPLALPALRARMSHRDLEVVKRVRKCIEVIERDGDRPLARPAIRRLIERRVPGAAEALIGYVPFAGDPAAEEDVWYGLDELVDKDPELLGVIEKALTDAQPPRRALAACILGRRGSAAQKTATRGLLKDADATVRLRAAQGLLAGRDKTGLPVLIDLLTEGSVEVRWQAEELLRWIANDRAPDAVVGAGDPKQAATCQNAWAAWWKEFGDKVDVAAREKEPNRPLLVLAFNRDKGRAWLVGCDGVTRWEWTGIDRLADAHYVPGGILLSLQSQPVRGKPLLSERTPLGTILWQHDDMRDPASCQRLSNGRVFVAERQDAPPYFWYQVVGPTEGVVERAKHDDPAPPQPAQEERRQPPAIPRANPARSATTRMIALLRTDDGKVLGGVTAQIPMPNSISQLHEFDPATSKTERVPHVGGATSSQSFIDRPGIEPTPDGLLLSNLRHRPSEHGCIREIEADGYPLWTHMLADVRHASRHRQGNTLACLSDRIVEITPDHRTVGDIPLPSGVSAGRPVRLLERATFDAGPPRMDLSLNPDGRLVNFAGKTDRAKIAALNRVAEYGPIASEVLPQLKAVASVTDPTFKAAAQRALLAAGVEAVPRLIEQSKTGDPAKRAEAVQAFRAYRRFPGVVEALIAALRDDDESVRTHALSQLGGYRSDPRSRTPDWRPEAAWGWTAAKVIPALIKAAGAENADHRQRAIHALGVLSTDGESAVPYLLNCLESSDVDKQGWAMAALGRIGQPTQRVLPALRAGLGAADVRVHGAAVTGLGYMGPSAIDALPDLLAFFERAKKEDSDTARTYQFHTMRTICKIAGHETRGVDFLLQIADDRDLHEQTRGFAVSFVSQLGPVAAKAMPSVHSDSVVTNSKVNLNRLLHSVRKGKPYRTPGWHY